MDCNAFVYVNSNNSEYFLNIDDSIDSFKLNQIIENTDIFVETYIRPIKVIIVGAVHIAQYIVDYAKSLNFEMNYLFN